MNTFIHPSISLDPIVTPHYLAKVKVCRSQGIQTQHSERQDLQSLEGQLFEIPVWSGRGGKLQTADGDFNLWCLVLCAKSGIAI